MKTEAYKAQLLNLSRELQAEEERGREGAQTIELDQTRVGRLSRMDALQSQAISAETQRRRHHQLLRVNAALKRIEDGDYGYCHSCGEDINEARLSIDPSATHCVRCADKAN